MSDYVRKSALIEALKQEIRLITPIEKNYEMFYHDSGYNNAIVSARLLVENIPPLDEKEIIRKTVERIVERVENARQKYQRLVKEQGEKEDEAINILFRGMMNIVKEEGGIE